VDNTKNLRIASLFAGCGGMDIGATGGFRFNNRLYRRLGTQIVHASDFDPGVIGIYNQNFNHNAVVADIRELNGNDLPAVDVMLGGFPCQSFSVIAQNPKRLGYRDDKGKLFFEMKRLIEAKRPRVFIAENVKGILSANQGEAFPLILKEFEDAGYHIKHQVLNASHYGVPQKRERVFIVGFRRRTDFQRFSFPTPTTFNSPVPLASFLEEDVDEKWFFSERAVAGMWASKNARAMNKGRAQDPSKPCNTVGAHLAKVSLNSTDPVYREQGRYRMFTPREVARIQSFPESFKLEASRKHAYVALGNAVPPVLMWHVMKSVIRALDG
jgi:DNA (cytosine-5)-methyltransferase 1